MGTLDDVSASFALSEARCGRTALPAARDHGRFPKPNPSAQPRQGNAPLALRRQDPQEFSYPLAVRVERCVAKPTHSVSTGFPRQAL